jgi:hypothetical protein
MRRRLLTALVVSGAVAASAAPAFAHGHIPKGLSAQAVLTVTGVTCSGTLTIGWNAKYTPATELDYAADPSLGGTPTPYADLFSTPYGATKVSTQVPFTLPSGQSTAYQITAKNGGTTITTTTSNTVSCP